MYPVDTQNYTKRIDSNHGNHNSPRIFKSKTIYQHLNPNEQSQDQNQNQKKGLQPQPQPRYYYIKCFHLLP